MPSGWLRGSIYWVLLFPDRFAVSKTIIPDAQERFLVSSGPCYTPSFGGLGLRRGGLRCCRFWLGVWCICRRIHCA